MGPVREIGASVGGEKRLFCLQNHVDIGYLIYYHNLYNYCWAVLFPMRVIQKYGRGKDQKSKSLPFLYF